MGICKWTTDNGEHYTVLSDPGNQCIAHLIPSSGKAKDITRELVDLCRELILDLKAVGANGARVNTGVDNGCIRLLNFNSQNHSTGLLANYTVMNLHLGISSTQFF